MTTSLNDKVIPGAASDQIAGWLGETRKVRVSAAPEKGKTNHAVVKLLTHRLELSSGSLRIIAGETAQPKTIEIEGISLAQTRERLEQ